MQLKGWEANSKQIIYLNNIINYRSRDLQEQVSTFNKLRALQSHHWNWLYSNKAEFWQAVQGKLRQRVRINSSKILNMYLKS